MGNLGITLSPNTGLTITPSNNLWHRYQAAMSEN